MKAFTEIIRQLGAAPRRWLSRLVQPSAPTQYYQIAEPRAWVRLHDEKTHCVPMKRFPTGQVVVKVYSDWHSVNPDGTGYRNDYITAWWPDPETNPQPRQEISLG